MQCALCAQKADEPVAAIRVGTPGASAAREHERRAAKDHLERRSAAPWFVTGAVFAAIVAYLLVQWILGEFSKVQVGLHAHKAHLAISLGTRHLAGALVGVLVAGSILTVVFGKRQTTDAFRSGAAGEREIGKLLDRLVPRGISVLHDLRIPGRRGNLDHLAVGPSGVFVINTKNHVGRVTVRTRGPIWNPGPPCLFIAGRDRSAYLESARRDAAGVTRSLEGHQLEDVVSVIPVIALAQAEWGWFAKPLECQGVWVVGPKGLTNLVTRPGELSSAAVRRVAGLLAERLEPA